jgi:hypothetical protein
MTNLLHSFQWIPKVNLHLQLLEARRKSLEARLFVNIAAAEAQQI